MCHRSLAEKIGAMGKGKVQVMGQTHPTPRRTRGPVTVLERWLEQLISPIPIHIMLLKTKRLANSEKKHQKAATYFNSHFPPNLGDEFCFDVMLWDKSLDFFSVASGGDLVLHLGEGRHLVQDTALCRPDCRQTSGQTTSKHPMGYSKLLAALNPPA